VSTLADSGLVTRVDAGRSHRMVLRSSKST